MLPEGASRWLQTEGLVLWLTGAGISAESGVPTFRGEEGYWRVGSRNYQSQEMATWASFCEMPDEVWAWYLYRRSVCRAAKPNAAHQALASLESAMGDDFLLITQNVDGLHLRAGSTLDRTYQVHGNIDFMRCLRACGAPPAPLPDVVPTHWDKGQPLSDAVREALQCEACGAQARPHVLWFDETYDEPNFRFESSLRAAARAKVLVVVGTTGTTNLPMQIGLTAARRGIPLLVINPEPNPFSELVDQTRRGTFLPGTAGHWVPQATDFIAEFRGQAPPLEPQ